MEMDPKLQVMYQAVLKPMIRSMTDEEFETIKAFVHTELDAETEHRSQVLEGETSTPTELT